MGVGFIVFFVLKSFLFKAVTIDKINMMIASEINKTSPIVVDFETRLDNTMVQPENIFAYNYTLINFVKESIGSLQIENAINPRMIQTINNYPDMEFKRNHQTTLSYNYSDKDGQHIVQF